MHVKTTTHLYKGPRLRRLLLLEATSQTFCAQGRQQNELRGIYTKLKGPVGLSHLRYVEATSARHPASSTLLLSFQNDIILSVLLSLLHFGLHKQNYKEARILINQSAKTDAVCFPLAANQVPCEA